jgi:LPXTG-site transpeptidase (sortase) family protein
MLKQHFRKMLTRRQVARSLILVGIVAAVGAALLLARQHSVEPRPPSGAVASQPAPSSAKLEPQVVASYTVPSTHPKYIAIPAIGIANTPVLELGLLSNGAIATPNNINEAGWYDASSQPGQSRAMFIYGHVSSWKANGIFYNLKKLKLGDKITVIRGDNTTYVYQVVRTKVYSYDKVDMAEVLSPINAGKPGLNLMTCTGKIIEGTSEFSQRLVVFTSLVKS